MIGGLGTTELLLIFGIVVILFGGSRIPQIARGLGKGIKDFKKMKKDVDNNIDEIKKEISIDEDGKGGDDSVSPKVDNKESGENFKKRT